RPAMTDRELETISGFLRHFASFGCRQISGRRTELKPSPRKTWAASSLETLDAWRVSTVSPALLDPLAAAARTSPTARSGFPDPDREGRPRARRQSAGSDLPHRGGLVRSPRARQHSQIRPAGPTGSRP